MKIQNLSSESFNGLRITKQAKKIITSYYQTELKQANKLYLERLAVKYNKKPNVKKIQDEKLFEKSFSSAWDKLDAADKFIMEYSMDDIKNLSFKKKGNAIIAEIYDTFFGQRIRTENKKIHDSKEFFSFALDKAFKILKEERTIRG